MPLNEYMLFIESDAPTKGAFGAAIALAAGETHTPLFSPHITLLGGLHEDEAALIQKLHELVEGQAAFEITLENLARTNLFYKSIFIEAQKSQPLTDLNAKAQRLFGKSVDYLPHISLVYGVFPDEVKNKLEQEIEALTLPKSYPAVTISLWLALGTVKDWRKIAEVQLK